MFRYSMSSNKNKLPQNTIVVDEGEFAVTDISNPLATWGVTQCIVMYIHTNIKHALAHIDTRTEKWSLDLIFTELSDITSMKIELIGARGDISLVDSPKMNKQKVEDYLSAKQYNFAWITGSWNSMIAYGDEMYNEATYLRPQAITPGCSSKQLMLNGPFYGSFPLTMAMSDINTYVYLNERLTYQLLFNIKNAILDEDWSLHQACQAYSES